MPPGLVDPGDHPAPAGDRDDVGAVTDAELPANAGQGPQ